MSTSRTLPDRFLVAFSFAGEQRDLVRSIAEAVEQRLGRGTVFFDEWFKHEIVLLNRSDLRLQRIYKEQTELVVICLSKEYAAKVWPTTEWDAIRSRRLTSPSGSATNADDIWPLRVGDGDVAGVFENTIWDDARKSAPAQTADSIVARLRMLAPDAGKPRAFLAECTSDLEDEDRPVNRPGLKRFLERAGWCVLPASGESLVDPPTGYRERLWNHMQSCQAFVQLLGKHPWRGGGFDRVQHEVAVELNLPEFRFRGDVELDPLKSANPSHYELLKDAAGGGFQDFKDDLAKRLASLVQQRTAAIRQAQQEETRVAAGRADDDDPPLVRVAIRSRRRKELWSIIFDLLYEQQDILPIELGANESLDGKQEVEPCHGFLVLCDDAALNDDQQRNDTEQCRLIQSKEKRAERRPPIGLVFWAPSEWPPPEPTSAWPQLLRSPPPKQLLYRMLGDALDLSAFVAHVRRVHLAWRASS